MSQSARGNEVVEYPFVYSYISSATTTNVKASSGVLHAINVEGGTAGTISVYDDPTTSNNPIAVFDSTNALATYTFNVNFANGLTVITSAATQLTVSYI